ncbi:hypothetical protein CBS101457_003622 [Exobasidium rhododendri]|nr:hypothetical protein CBS101457_003622 [Exobasidium rhododendri]
MAKGDAKPKAEEEEVDAPPNFFCRLPSKDLSKKVDRAASPPPLAFLQHIIANYRQQTPEDERADLRGNGHTSDDRGNGNTALTAANSSGGSGGSNNNSTNISQAHNRAERARQEALGNIAAFSSSTSSSSNASELTSPEVEDIEDDAPWFSQLANLPQVRSAGIPMIAPTASGRGIQSSHQKQKAFEATLSAPSSSRPPESTMSSGSLQTVASLLSSSVDTQVGMGTSTDTSFSKTKLAEGKSHSFSALAQSTTSTSSLPLVPPENFAMVNSWVYRSSFPKKRHFPFLKTLGLKSVLTLILEEYPEQNTQFLDDNGITFFQFGIPGNKEPFVQIPQDKITAALITILDRRNHPILIHCNKGKHRTGCLIGCLRKLQQWSLTAIFDEYRRFSVPKSRSMDQEFIELYSEDIVWLHVERQWLPRWAVLAKGKRGPVEEESQQDRIKHHQTVAAHSNLSLTVDTLHRLKMKGM